MDRVSKAERELVRKIQRQTNADRIRAMTDEELAEFISGKARTFGEEYEGYMSAFDWLKEEA
jgi:hypothetical protein